MSSRCLRDVLESVPNAEIGESTLVNSWPAPATLMVVHAHPDDESSQTGGTLARCAAAGWRTILVTCTDGSQGSDTAGRTSGEVGHDPGGVARHRSAELDSAASILGVHEVVKLGYPDSGADADTAPPDSFSRQPEAPMVRRLVRLIEFYGPAVLVTYPSNGLSGHPDHIRTHDIVTAAHRHVVDNAAARAGVIPHLYHIALSRTLLLDIADRARAVGAAHDWSPPESMGIADDEITTTIDVSAYWAQKVGALAAHASQADAALLLGIFTAIGGTGAAVEQYVRVYPSPSDPPPTPEQGFLGES